MRRIGAGWIRWCARQPALHFLVLGGLLFTGREHLFSERGPPREPVLITAAQVAGARLDFARQHGREPTPAEARTLVEGLVTEELLYLEALHRGLDRGDIVVVRRLIQVMRFVAEDPERPIEELYREALELGLDRGDPIVRRRLVQQMRLRAQADGGAVRPTSEEVKAYYERHRERFTEPARVSLTQVYLSRQTYGERLEAEADRLLSELRRRGVAPREAPALGEAFLLGHHLSKTSRAALERDFGERFAEHAFASDSGAWDVAPSPYGLHLIRVGERWPEAPAPLEAVRDKVLQGLAEERRQQRFETELARLRQLYDVEIETPAP